MRNELYHYGVKGMKWSRKKSKDTDKKSKEPTFKDYVNATKSIGKTLIKKKTKSISNLVQGKYKKVTLKDVYKKSATNKALKKISDAYSISKSELYHHGIKGQRWGVQNGPPYPLDQKHELKTLHKVTSKKESLWNNYNSEYKKHSKAMKAIDSDEKISKYKESAFDARNTIRDELDKDFKKNIRKYEDYYKKNILSKFDDDEFADYIKSSKSNLHEAMIEEMAYNKGDEYSNHIYRDIIKSDKKKYKPLINNYKLATNLYESYLEDVANNITGKYADTPISRNALYVTDTMAKTYKDLVKETADQNLGYILYHTKTQDKLYWEKGLVD